MDLKRIVKIIVIAQLIIGHVTLVIHLKSIPNLPPNLQSYLFDVMNPNIDMAYHNWFSFFIPPIIFVASIIGSIGVFFQTLGSHCLSLDINNFAVNRYSFGSHNH